LSQSNPSIVTSHLNIDLTALNNISTTNTNITANNRVRSNLSAIVNASKQATEVSAVTIVKTDIFDFMDTPVKDTEVSISVTQTTVAAPNDEYLEDLIDYDDDELAPANHDSGDDTLIGIDDTDIKLEEETTEAKNKSMAEEQAENAQSEQTAVAHRLEQAKYVMSLGPQTLFSSSPGLASALQLNDVGDTVTVNAYVNGVTYEISWKVEAFYDEEPQPTVEQPTTSLTVDTAPRKTSLRDAAPLSGPTLFLAHTATKCKFGRACSKGAACLFDHTVKPKLCTWVNTAQGCTKANACECSHENEGVKCTRSTTRFVCANGKGCAFKHGDDINNMPKVKAVAAPVEQVKAVKGTPPPNAPTGPKATGTPPTNAPTGPKNNNKNAQQPAKVGGQKRGREQDDDGGNATQDKRVNDSTGNFNAGGGHRVVKQHRGRGRGRGNGRSRGRGGGGVITGGEFSIKGAATGG
jgi:hypothetical protein